MPAFAVALRRLIGDADERKRLAAGARAAAAKLPTWQDSAKIVARTLEAHTALVASFEQEIERLLAER